MASVALLLLLVASSVVFSSHSVICKRISNSPWALQYHHGSVLSGKDPIQLYVTFYGVFSSSERAIVKAFLASLNAPSSDESESLKTPSVIKLSKTPSVTAWWSLTHAYADSFGQGVSQYLEVLGESIDGYSLGRELKRDDIARLARSTIDRSSTPLTSKSMVVVMTAADVFVEGFCMHSCGGHGHTYTASLSLQTSEGPAALPYVWVGNSKFQCPGFCAWPFAKPAYGPPMEPLIAPNGVAQDGMVMNLARVLVAAATNPYGTAYYEGDGAFVLREAAGACAGVFGHGAYPGYPGDLLVDPIMKSSYNMEGIEGTQFLVPWIWNPVTMSCAGQP